MHPKRSRTYHDPLHGAIALDRQDPVEQLLIRLIDTPAFQRLRRVRQLGAASLTFHGAESSRFTHALGVMELTRKAFDLLVKRYPSLASHRATVLCAALLHDIGHGPYSHTAEAIFKTHHEHWTRRIIGESAPVQALLAEFDPALTAAIASVYTHQHSLPLVWQLVSSQLDCDRLDYLMRD
ncbi:MAG: HD domain-containing protein, partial [Cyanobacteria bacterium P01_A01_bin.70]